MLWRFGLQHTSNIDKLLEKEDLTLEEVLNDPDLLQEVRDQTPKVVSYLTRPQNLKQMVDYIATEDFFKFSKMAATSCDVLCSNSITFVESLILPYSSRDFADSDEEYDDDEEDDESDGVLGDGRASASASASASKRAAGSRVGSNQNANSDDGNHDGDDSTDDAAGSNALTPQKSRRDSSPGSPLAQHPTRQALLSSPFSSANNNNSNTGSGSGSNNPTNTTTTMPRQHLLESLWGVMALPGGQLDALQATYFSRVMCTLLQRKPYETLDFIRAQGNAVPLFLEHLSVSAVVDLLLKIISLEELENDPGIIAWLSEYRLIPMLVDRLSPECDPEIHSLAAQVLLDIIAISQCNNPAQPTIGINALIEELKSEATVTRLTKYMLDRTAPHATSTLINCVYIFIELIRRNYSDADADAEADMSPENQAQTYSFGGAYDNAGAYDQGHSQRRLPIVDLSDMMRVLALHTQDLVELLQSPRSSTEPVPTTMGPREPLGFERLRICELFAELLHCSNMPRLNVSASASPSVSVATSAPESVLGGNGNSTIASTAMEDDAEEADARLEDRPDSEDTPTHKDSPTVIGFPPTRVGRGSPSGSSAQSPSPQQPFSPSSASAAKSLLSPSLQLSGGDKGSSDSSSSSSGGGANYRPGSHIDADSCNSPSFAHIPLELSNPSDHDAASTPVGQLLKWKLIQHNVLPICADLFFRFSLNNFLHSVVYDIMHQVLNLPLVLECNLALIVVAFRDVRITSRIAQACTQNDKACHEPRGVRLGYMGHLTGIGEEVARLLELSGAALEPLISPYIDGDEWLEYVARTLQEVRERDQQPLGGERPGGGVGGADMMAADTASQMFVSRMGLVDPSSSEAYGPEDDDEDIDDEEMDDEDDDEDDGDDDEDEEMADADGGRSSTKRFGGGRMVGYAGGADGFGHGGAGGPKGGLLYPNEEDDGEDGAEYVAAHQNMYFGRGAVDAPHVAQGSNHGHFGLRPPIGDDTDQFIIHDEDEDDDEDEDADVGIDSGFAPPADASGVGDGGSGIGPAGSIGRFRSYQNEQSTTLSKTKAKAKTNGGAAASAGNHGGIGNGDGDGDDNDDDDDIVDETVDRQRRARAASAMDEDDNADNDEIHDDEDGASESGRMRDFMRSREADMAEASRQQKFVSPAGSASGSGSSSTSASGGSGSADEQGKGGSLLVYSDCVDDGARSTLGFPADTLPNGSGSQLKQKQQLKQQQQQQQQPSTAADSKKERRQLVRLSFDGSAHTIAAVDHLDDASLPSYLLALPDIPSSPSSSNPLFPSPITSEFPPILAPNSRDSPSSVLTTLPPPNSSCSSTSSSLPLLAAASIGGSRSSMADSCVATGTSTSSTKIDHTTSANVTATHAASKAASLAYKNTTEADDQQQQQQQQQQHDALSAPPQVPPRPPASLLLSMPPPPPIPPHFFGAPQVSSSKSKNVFVESKGRLQDLYRESKQRSLSSSELDNIVPTDISAWGTGESSYSINNSSSKVGGSGSGSTSTRSSLSIDNSSAGNASGAVASQSSDAADSGDASDALTRRGRAGSFAARRQRSRSQSAGVGISREMVIQAAVKGQFPYLDAKTCEFVGQLKTDVVTLGGAAAGASRDAATTASTSTLTSTSTSRQRSKTTASGMALRGQSIPGQSGSAPSSVASSPVARPAIHLREGSGNGGVSCSGSSGGGNGGSGGSGSGDGAGNVYSSSPPSLPSALNPQQSNGMRPSGLRNSRAEALLDSEDEDEEEEEEELKSRREANECGKTVGTDTDSSDSLSLSYSAPSSKVHGVNATNYSSCVWNSSSNRGSGETRGVENADADAGDDDSGGAHGENGLSYALTRKHHHTTQSLDGSGGNTNGQKATATLTGLGFTAGAIPSALSIPSANAEVVSTSITGPSSSLSSSLSVATGRNTAVAADLYDGRDGTGRGSASGGSSGGGGWRRTRRDRGGAPGKKTNAGGIASMMPTFPTLPMSPVHKSTPIMLDPMNASSSPLPASPK
ncbi:sporulation-induced protein [Coemansia sp. Benny D115]|nr:sporulation-induced protein [Coemansia sp. Benny D115]